MVRRLRSAEACPPSPAATPTLASRFWMLADTAWSSLSMASMRAWASWAKVSEASRFVPSGASMVIVIWLGSLSGKNSTPVGATANMAITTKNRPSVPPSRRARLSVRTSVVRSPASTMPAAPSATIRPGKTISVRIVATSMPAADERQHQHPQHQRADHEPGLDGRAAPQEQALGGEHERAQDADEQQDATGDQQDHGRIPGQPEQHPAEQQEHEAHRQRDERAGVAQKAPLDGVVALQHPGQEAAVDGRQARQARPHEPVGEGLERVAEDQDGRHHGDAQDEQRDRVQDADQHRAQQRHGGAGRGAPRGSPSCRRPARPPGRSSR